MAPRYLLHGGHSVAGQKTFLYNQSDAAIEAWLEREGGYFRGVLGFRALIVGHIVNAVFGSVDFDQDILGLVTP